MRAQDIPVPEWFAASLLDLREDVAEAAGEGKRVMLYFGQAGCPACEKLVRHTFGDPKIKTTARKHFLPLAINVWGDREVTWMDGKKLSEKQLAAMLKVQATPTLMFLDEKGAIAQRLTGYLSPAQFEPRLDAAMGKVPAARRTN